VNHAAETQGDGSVTARMPDLDWNGIAERLDQEGFAVVSGLLDGETCAALVHDYDDDHRYRNRVIMARHGFGRGEYKYFGNPLPPVVAELRAALYPPLSGIVNRWNEALGLDKRFPETLAAYLEACHAAGQTKPTPLILNYKADDYNCLHQDLYGEMVFPLQAAILLSRPAKNFRAVNS
jgi:hypothetical protein